MIPAWAPGSSCSARRTGKCRTHGPTSGHNYCATSASGGDQPPTEIATGDRLVYYAVGWERFFAIAEVISDEPYEPTATQEWEAQWRWAVDIPLTSPSFGGLNRHSTRSSERPSSSLTSYCSSPSSNHSIGTVVSSTGGSSGSPAPFSNHPVSAGVSSTGSAGVGSSDGSGVLGSSTINSDSSDANGRRQQTGGKGQVRDEKRGCLSPVDPGVPAQGLRVPPEL
jgi:hypothetical protein